MPDVLDAEELKKLLAELQNPVRALVFLIAARGLRVSEALGLKWSDVDFGNGAINLSRGIVHRHVGEMKTEASQKPVPMGRVGYFTLCMERADALPTAGRLGIRQPEDERQATLLAGNTPEVLRAAYRQTPEHHEEDRLAHLPQDLGNPSQRQR